MYLQHVGVFLVLMQKMSNFQHGPKEGENARRLDHPSVLEHDFHKISSEMQTIIIYSSSATNSALTTTCEYVTS
jgi:hypothetical protein